MDNRSCQLDVLNSSFCWLLMISLIPSLYTLYTHNQGLIHSQASSWDTYSLPISLGGWSWLRRGTSGTSSVTTSVSAASGETTTHSPTFHHHLHHVHHICHRVVATSTSCVTHARLVLAFFQYSDLPGLEQTFIQKLRINDWFFLFELNISITKNWLRTVAYPLGCLVILSTGMVTLAISPHSPKCSFRSSTDAVKCTFLTKIERSSGSSLATGATPAASCFSK